MLNIKCDLAEARHFAITTQSLTISILGNLEELKKELNNNSFVTKWEEVPEKIVLKLVFRGGFLRLCNHHVDNRTTQGVVEEINNKLKLIKRRSYGFINFDNFSLRCFLTWLFPVSFTS